jgi:(2Fe-2S) ferredoxin
MTNDSYLARKAEMTYANQYRVFVCTKQRDRTDPKGCCHHCNAVEIYQAFLDEIKQQQLEHQVEVRGSGCLDHCEVGAVALAAQVKGTEPSWLPIKLQKRLLLQKHWYVHLTVEDIPELVESHFANGQPLERKLYV